MYLHGSAEGGGLVYQHAQGLENCVACGTEPKLLMAELFGKATGISGERAAPCTYSISLMAISGQTALVAGGTSIAVGAAITER